MKSILKRFLKKKEIQKNDIPFKGYTEHLNSIPFLDYLPDEKVQELNDIVDWKAFVVDSNGRRFGNAAWKGKRVTPQPIPDPRHQLLNDRINLRNKTVLEIGCFEGIHTIGLCTFGANVIAIDSRMENIVKTMVRCGFFNVKPSVFQCDVEAWNMDTALLKADVCHHIGVLYHLKDPIAHLKKLSGLISHGIFLDTHIALPTDTLETYTSEGKEYRYKKYKEGGLRDVFSGMYDHAKWLLLADLTTLLKECGFANVEVIEERAERNGPRILLFASKT